MPIMIVMDPFRWTGLWVRLPRGLLLGAIIPFWLAACATPLSVEVEAEDRLAKQFVPDSENGIVYIFRKSSVIFGALGAMFEEQQGLGFLIHFDGQTMGKLKTWEFLRVVAPPGAHDIVATNTGSGRQVRIPLDVEKGRLYFMEVLAYEGKLRPSPPPHLVVVDDKAGKQAVLDSTVVMLEKEPKMLR